MAAVDLNNMAAQIQTVLSGVSGMAIAYDYEPQNLQQLPAATLYFDGFEENEETMGRLQYEWRWTIRLYIPLSASDVGPAQVQLRTLTASTLQAFRTATGLTLNGSCMFCSVASGDVYNVLNATNPLMVIELTLQATTQESRG